MPQPTRDPLDDGCLMCTVAPGETQRLNTAKGHDLPWTLVALNKATNAAALFEVCGTYADEADEIIVPLGISSDGTLAAGDSVIQDMPTRVRAILVTVPDEADGDTIVRVLQ